PPRHCEQRGGVRRSFGEGGSNPESRKKEQDCFVAKAPRNDGAGFPPTSPRHCEFGTGLRPTRVDETASHKGSLMVRSRALARRLEPWATRPSTRNGFAVVAGDARSRERAPQDEGLVRSQAQEKSIP